ncbi:MAG: hypothetical protein SVM80_07030, partial [Halobacteriota archaeon]|nr:hypothetical protein [Halobacteriota archaeon]
KKRSPGERPYAVIKNIFKSGHVKVTTVARVHVKMIFAEFSKQGATRCAGLDVRIYDIHDLEENLP